MNDDTPATVPGTDVAVTPDHEFRKELERIDTGLENAAGLLLRIAGAMNDLEQVAKTEPGVTIANLGIAYFRMKERYDELDKLVKVVYHFADAMNKFVLPEKMRALDIEAFRVPEIARSFSIVDKTSASFVDKEAGLAWLRELGQGDMIQETVNAGTLSSFCRNLVLEQGIDPPEEVVKMSVYSTTSMVKYRPK